MSEKFVDELKRRIDAVTREIERYSEMNRNNQRVIDDYRETLADLQNAYVTLTGKLPGKKT